MMRIPVYIVSLVLWAVLLRYYLQMFQQNSNRPERFWRWFVKDPLPRPFAPSKLKFVWTPRMKRLALASSLLFVAFSAAPALASSALWTAFVALAAAILAPFVLLLANLVLTPLEKAINRGYYRDAQRILREHKDLIIIGVTGSFGKTSVKNYLYRLLSEKYNVLMTPGNYNTTLGVVRTIRERLEPYHQVFIVEMGAKQVGDIKEICDLVHPSIGIVTAVGDMHLETFGSRENIRKTKFELIDALPKSGFGVINEESEGIAGYSGVPDHCRILKYGIDAHRVDVRAANISYGAAGMDFDLIGRAESVHYRTRLLGDANVLNLAAAAIVAEELGVSAADRQKAVLKLQPVEHRLSISRRGGLTILDDAYNSNPVGAAMALDVISRMKLPEGGRRIVVTPGFVELGARQKDACRHLGLEVARSADFLVIVNRYNRESILAGAYEGGMSEDNVLCVDSLGEAVAALGALATPGSVVLYENDLPDTFK